MVLKGKELDGRFTDKYVHSNELNCFTCIFSLDRVMLEVAASFPPEESGVVRLVVDCFSSFYAKVMMLLTVIS